MFLSDKAQSSLNCKVNWKLLECSMEIRGWHHFSQLVQRKGIEASSSLLPPEFPSGTKVLKQQKKICCRWEEFTISFRDLCQLSKHEGLVLSSQICTLNLARLGIFFCRFSLALLGSNPPKCFGSSSSFMVFQRDMKIRRIAITALHGLYLVIYWWFRSKHM